MGNFIDAKATLREQIDLEPNDSKLLYTFSKIYAMENDLLNEVNYLEKVKSITNTKRISPILVTETELRTFTTNRICSMKHFYYLDSLNYDPVNLEALIRLAFMAVGQKTLKSQTNLCDRFQTKK